MGPSDDWLHVWAELEAEGDEGAGRHSESTPGDRSLD